MDGQQLTIAPFAQALLSPQPDPIAILRALEVLPRPVLDQLQAMLMGNPEAAVNAALQGVLNGRSPAELLEPEEEAQAALEEELGRVITNTTHRVLSQIGECVFCGKHQRVSALLRTPLHTDADTEDDGANH